MSVDNELPPSAPWAGDRVVEALEALVDRLGYVPTGLEYREHSSGDPDLPDYSTIHRAYGGYVPALKAAGIHPAGRFGSVDEALELAEELDVDPTPLLEGKGGGRA